MSWLTKPIERTIVNKYIKIDQYKCVRSDFLNIYEDTSNSDTVKNEFSEFKIDVIKEEAQEKGDECVDFDPHSTVHDSIGMVKGIYKLIRLIILIVTLVLLFLGFITSQTLQIITEATNIVRWATTIGLPVTFITTASVYLEILKRDTVLIQEMNRKLRIDDETIDEEQDVRKSVSYYYWNKSLLSNTMIPVLAFLAVMNVVVPSMYNPGMGLAHRLIHDTLYDGEPLQTLLKFVSGEEYALETHS